MWVTMFRVSRLCGLLLLLMFFSSVSMAKKELNIGIGNFPPFFIEKDQQGLFLEVTEEIFNHFPEFSVQFIYMSNHRLVHEINLGNRIDVACNIFSNSSVNGFLSAPIYRYRDVAISKNEAKLTINQVDDLQGLSIAAYQGAQELLGKEFKDMTLNNLNYSEHSQPKETTYLMITGQKDIRIGDINTFLYDLADNNYKKKANVSVADFTIHKLWPDMYSHMAFKDEALRNAVNKVIKKLTNDGTIDAIYLKYNQHFN